MLAKSSVYVSRYWVEGQLCITNSFVENPIAIFNLYIIISPQSILYYIERVKYAFENLLVVIHGPGPQGGVVHGPSPWGSMGVDHGPGPRGGPWTWIHVLYMSIHVMSI